MDKEIIFKTPEEVNGDSVFAYWMKVGDLIIGFDNAELVKQLLKEEEYEEK